MAFSSGFSDIKLSELFNKVSEEQLVAYYLNINTIPCKISAPYRQDSNPSLGIYMNRNGKIQFTDFGTKDSGGILDLLMKIWNCDFKKCVDIISKDLDKINKKVEIRKTLGITKTLSHRTSSNIQVKFREWRKYDLEFWESFGISKPWLEFGEVYPISRIFYINENKITDYPADKYAYAYIERKDGNITLKIYQPFSETRKWISKHDASVWDLWTKIPDKGPRLIITSSRKDALCVWENTGIPCVSLQGEGYIPKEQVVMELKKRFTDIYILYDNDFKSDENHGHIFGKKLSEMFQLIQIEIPEEYKSKDPSDLCKNYNRETVQKVINKLIADKESDMDDLPF